MIQIRLILKKTETPHLLKRIYVKSLLLKVIGTCTIWIYSDGFKVF